MKLKKLLGMMLALMLLLALVPVTALADGEQPGMVLGHSVLAAEANTADAATVHYGGHTWRVIGYNGNANGVATAEGNMTLLAAGAISRSAYDNSQYSNIYGTNTNRPEGEQDSALKRAVDAIAGQLTAGEQGAVAPRTLTGGSANYGQEGYGENLISGPTVENALLWPLSTREATQVNEQLRIVDPDHPGWATSYWWLRSPGADVNSAAVVSGDGTVVYSISFYDLSMDYDDFGVRPAFNVKLNSVLFTSAAAGGKSSGAEGAYALTEVSAYSGNEWKLTITDTAHQNFSVGTPTYDSNTRTVTVPYSGAVTGENQYLSAAIVNSSGAVTYYGRVAEATDTSGSVDISVCGRLTTGDTLYVFNEQCNGDNATDYASELYAISLPTEAYGTAHTEATDAAVPASCTESGLTAGSHCSACGEVFTAQETVSATGHTEVTDPAVPATCTETGLTEGRHCSVCDEVLVAQETVDALGHDWGDWTVTREAQPGAAGERQHTCSRCDTVETEEIPALPVYTVTQGAGGSWTQGSGTDYVITVTSNEDNANCFSHYTGTLIDGQRAAVSARSGSTIVTIPVDVLERLSVGAHTVTVKFDNGEVSTQLTIKAAETTAAETTAADPGRVPTGDSSHTGLWIGLACAAGAACVGLAVREKKRRM